MSTDIVMEMAVIPMNTHRRAHEACRRTNFKTVTPCLRLMHILTGQGTMEIMPQDLYKELEFDTFRKTTLELVFIIRKE
ncbi:hypothetical protein T11_8898 [Trichinella zimbabwensis]|uniref:Uncharacterized protein n=1 Tax=Trichinella zimbabwensis TaxID=268475 RepID=A0A0V1HD98_9BILA|nr:hypothetical protein T11_8898 [Trichinella zimbabwensis]